MRPPLAEWIEAEFAANANPVDAAQMQAYLKTEMPFFGIKAKDRDAFISQGYGYHAPFKRDRLLAALESLWEGPQRELKYAAIRLARDRLIRTPESMPMFERWIVEGAWWDLVDEIAIHLVGRVLRGDPDRIWPIIDGWIERDDLWLRRAAIICQIRARQDTDFKRLARYCKSQLADTDFFIRKAIGWALREYGDLDPYPVIDFVRAERANMAGLTWREATRKLKKKGLLRDP